MPDFDLWTDEETRDPVFAASVLSAYPLMDDPEEDAAWANW